MTTNALSGPEIPPQRITAFAQLAALIFPLAGAAWANLFAQPRAGSALTIG
jgi:hypothetical protein